MIRISEFSNVMAAISSAVIEFTKNQTNLTHLLEERKHRLSVCLGQSMTSKHNLHA